MQNLNRLTTVVKPVLFLIVLMALPTAFVLAGPRSLGGEPAPIDGGISLLVAAGIGYGAKKVRDARKKGAKAVKDEVQNEDGAKFQ